jgi:hypothetical protein
VESLAGAFVPSGAGHGNGWMATDLKQQRPARSGWSDENDVEFSRWGGELLCNAS